MLIRMNDTRLYHEANKTYISLQEYTSRERKTAHLTHVLPSFFTEPSKVARNVPTKEAVCEKLLFLGRIRHNPTDSQENTPVEQNVMWHMLTVDSGGGLGCMDGGTFIMRINCLGVGYMQIFSSLTGKN